MFDTDQVDHLLKTVMRDNSKDVLWSEAFKEYNAANPRTLSMGCRMCYPKVLQFILDHRSR